MSTDPICTPDTAFSRASSLNSLNCCPEDVFFGCIDRTTEARGIFDTFQFVRSLKSLFFCSYQRSTCGIPGNSEDQILISATDLPLLPDPLNIPKMPFLLAIQCSPASSKLPNSHKVISSREFSAKLKSDRRPRTEVDSLIISPSKLPFPRSAGLLKSLAVIYLGRTDHGPFCQGLTYADSESLAQSDCRGSPRRVHSCAGVDGDLPDAHG